MAVEDRPIFILKIGKEGQDPEPVVLNTRLQSMKYEDNESKTDKLTLELDNFDFAFLDGDTFKKGNLLEASFGYAGNMQTVKCFVQRISGHLTGQLSIEADHTSFLMHKNKKSRQFENATRSEVVKKIADDNGFGTADVDIQDTKVRYEVIVQPAITDAEFIKRLAHKEGFVYFVDSSGLHFHEKKLDQPPVKTLRWFTDRTGEIISGDFESESKKKKGRIQSEGRDTVTKKPITVDSKNTTVPRSSLASVLEHVDAKTGQTSLQFRLSDDDVRPSLESNASAAKAESDGAFKNQERSTFKLKLDVLGDPALRAKRIVEITGIGKRWSGLWYIQKCTHEIDTHYVTKLEMVRDTHNGHKGVSKDTKTSGAVNNQKVDTQEARQIEVVDPKTGKTHLEWHLK